MDIRTELENAVNVKQGKSEDVKEYVVRLAETVDRETTDDAFESLSLDAKEWMNKAITSYKSHQKLPDLPSMTKTDIPGAPVVQSTPTVTPKPTATQTADTFDPEPPSKEELSRLVMSNLVAELKPKKVKKVKVKKILGPPPKSSVIREVVCQNPYLTLSEIEKLLTERNIPFKSDLVRNILAYVTATLKTLDSLGLLKNSSLKGQSESAKLRELICSNPTWDINAVKQVALDQGIKCSPATISVAFYHVRGTMGTLKKLGMVD